MKTKILFCFTLAIAFAQAALAQTVVTRVRVSDGKGYDERPLIAPLANGTYAVIWDRTTGDFPVTLRGRIVRADATTATLIKKGILGPSLNQYTSFSAAPLGGTTDRFVVSGTRASDTHIITRVYDSKLAAKSPLRLSSFFGYNSRLATSSTGAVIAWNGDSGGAITVVDGGGILNGTPLVIDSASATTFLQPSRLVQTPTGYCVAGVETMNDYSVARPATVYVAPDLSTASALNLLTSSYAASLLLPDAAFLPDGGYSLFGRINDDNASTGYIRKLKSDTRPSGGAKRFPAGGTSFTSYYRIVPLTGTDRYAVSWYNFSHGLMYLQIRSKSGAALGDPVPISDNSYSIDDTTIDMAYDAATGRLLVVYAEFPAIPITHQDVMLALFDVSASGAPPTPSR